MATKREAIPADKLEAARRRAQAARAQYAHKPRLEELFTPEELANAAPFYFELRAFIAQLKEAREAAGLTLADVAKQTRLTVEYLSRLETGAQTNPTWKTLGSYAVAVGKNMRLALEQ